MFVFAIAGLAIAAPRKPILRPARRGVQQRPETQLGHRSRLETVLRSGLPLDSRARSASQRRARRGEVRPRAAVVVVRWPGSPRCRRVNGSSYPSPLSSIRPTRRSTTQTSRADGAWPGAGTEKASGMGTAGTKKSYLHERRVRHPLLDTPCVIKFGPPKDTTIGGQRGNEAHLRHRVRFRDGSCG